MLCTLQFAKKKYTIYTTSAGIKLKRRTKKIKKSFFSSKLCGIRLGTYLALKHIKYVTIIFKTPINKIIFQSLEGLRSVHKIKIKKLIPQLSIALNGCRKRKIKRL